MKISTPKKCYGIAQNGKLILDSLYSLKRNALIYGKTLLPLDKRKDYVEHPLQTLKDNGFDLVVIEMSARIWQNKHWRNHENKNNAKAKGSKEEKYCSGESNAPRFQKSE